MHCIAFVFEAERDESRPYAGAWQLVDMCQSGKNLKNYLVIDLYSIFQTYQEKAPNFIFFVKFMSQKRPQKIRQIERKYRDKKVFWVLQRCCFCVFGCQSIAFACSKQPFYIVKAML